MEATFIKFDKKSIFQTLSVEILSYGPLNSDFVCCPGLLFTELCRVTPNADAFSGVLR